MTPAPARAAHSSEWTRADWTAYADRLLEGAMAHGSAGRGRILIPGAEGGYGRDVDGLEGFARTFLIAGFRIAGERGRGVDHLIDFFSQGIRAGVDPDAPDRWVRMEEHAQAKVEAASIALILDLTRPWIWDRLDALTQQRVIDYLAPAVGDDTYPPINWLWFRVVVQTFLRSVGGPWSADDIAADLALHDTFARGEGWMADGAARSYDHYVGWALHLYPVLWARMAGAADLAGDRIAADRASLDRFLQDAVHLVGADGSPLIQGRSLIYRFAAAAPFWAGVVADVPSVSAGALRHAAARIVSHFADRGIPDDRGVLTMGWHGEWRQLAQSYSGPGSPYWAAKGLLGIMLPADHPVWDAPAEPLPVERGDFVRAIAAPGWIVSGTATDGIVRVANHGTDHEVEGALVADSPLYARLGYSTATSPLLDARGWREPLEQSVSLVDPTGAATHRAGMSCHGVRAGDGVGVGASTAVAHTFSADADQVAHGSGLRGTAEAVARLSVVSIVRGAHEVRLARVDDPESSLAGWRLRWGGWPAAGARVDARVETAPDAIAIASVEGTTSAIRALGHVASARVEQRRDASPLGETAAVPVLESAVVVGEWRAVELALSGAEELPHVQLRLDGDSAHITWPDGVETTTALSDLRLAQPAQR
ncbi:DUF2264 domain-containing protein [Microbacterium sp. JZ37]|uniref:DUF2264 domain-containing protein n=1 Tax=Microbacterium sp. JZ37 TaxID=2654193 RepID=UPI002B46DBAE|nr:DUF2264 domain-containing protein [Microbacterium sp. JZ37]WRH16389.1 DUF2264 domain-containing protein [Microbacterium sp. JZ37]